MSNHPRARRIVFSLLLLLLVGFAIEVMSFVVYRVAVGSFFSYGRDSDSRTALIAAAMRGHDPDGVAPDGPGGVPQGDAAPTLATQADQVIHPYLGYVLEPVVLKNRLEINPWGFYQRHPAPPRVDDAYRIGVVGGSVAFLFSFTGAPHLIEALDGADLLDGRPIEIVSLALGGMKQPQQLMTMAWMLSVGEEFDLVVNIDGFNEVAFGAENARRGVYPPYPRNWSLRVSDMTDLDQLELLGRASAWSGVRRRTAGVFEHGLVRWSVTTNLLWRLLDRAMSDRQAAAETAAAESVTAGLDYQASGPPFQADDFDALYTAVAGHWARASIALERLCRGYGIRYIHLLQPNQYVPDSKPMGDAERARAFDPKHIRRQAVLHGFPRLQAEAEALRGAGVDFHDLTSLFRDETRAVYSDTCCHFNPLGNKLMAERLATLLR